jgi:glycosyltransferase 2 family protein
MTEEQDHTRVFDNGKNPSLWNRSTLLSVLLAVAFLGVLASRVDVAQVWREAVSVDKGLLLLAALSHYATYPVRGARWKRCLKHVPSRDGRAGFGLLVFFYNFVDNLVPAKLGDVYASHLARINRGVRRSAALGSVAFLRMVDAWLVLILAAVASWRLFESEFPRSVAWALGIALVIAVVATVLIMSVIVLKRAVPAWLPEAVRQRVGAFHTGMLPDPGEILPVLFLSALIWAMETMWIFLLARAFHVRLGAEAAVFLTMIPIIATAFPITPSGAGAVELTLFGCLRLVGVASPVAVSFTVVNRFLDFWLHIALGAFIWTIRKSLGLRTWKDAPIPDDGGPEELPIPLEKELMP